MLCISNYILYEIKFLLQLPQFYDIIYYIHDIRKKGVLYMGALLTRQELIYLKNRFNARSAKFSKNETVLHIGENENHLCFLLDGTVYLCTENERCERSILRFFRSGEYFTSAMLIRSEYAVSYMTAKYPSEVVFFGREELFRFCAANPDWQAKFMEILSEQGSRNACFTDFVLHQRSIREKLLLFFRQEADIRNSDRIRLPLPYTDLSEFLACDRSAMMKELSKMKSEGIISGKNREIFMDMSAHTAR